MKKGILICLHDYCRYACHHSLGACFRYVPRETADCSADVGTCGLDYVRVAACLVFFRDLEQAVSRFHSGVFCPDDCIQDDAPRDAVGCTREPDDAPATVFCPNDADGSRDKDSAHQSAGYANDVLYN